MDKIKIVMDELDVRELSLQVTGSYIQDNTTTKRIDGDIIVTIDTEDYIENIFGREIEGKYYFARHQFIEKHPEINYYEEFFSKRLEEDPFEILLTFVENEVPEGFEFPDYKKAKEEGLREKYENIEDNQ